MKIRLRKLLFILLFANFSNQTLSKLPTHGDFLFSERHDHTPLQSFLSFKIVQASLATVGLFTISLAKRCYDFYTINRWLSNSIKSTLPKNTDFRFSAWKIQEYPTANELNDNKHAIIQALIHQKSLDDKIHVFGENHKRIEEPELKQIRIAINNEQQELKDTLKYLSRFTNLPQILLCFAHNRFDEKEGEQLIKDCNEKLELYCINSSGFQELHPENTIRRKCSAVMQNIPTLPPERFLRYFIHRPISISNDNEYQRTWNPFRWSLAPRTAQSNVLYFDVFKRFLRLSALKNIIDSEAATKAF